MNIRAAILDQIRLVAEQHNKRLPPLSDDLSLVESGLDSLCIAVLVANLEDQLGVDPFATGDDFAIPVTIGDLVDLYQHATV